MKEAQIFENWINNLSEGTWALPETPEQMEKLNQLMSGELIVGPDATNATEQLYDIVGDDELFDILNDLADRSEGRANCWDDSDVQRRLAELGIQTPESTRAEPADVDQDEAPPVAEGDMDEGDNQSTFVKELDEAPYDGPYDKPIRFQPGDSQAYRDAMAQGRGIRIQNRADAAEKTLAQRAAEPKNIGQKVARDIGDPLKQLAKGNVKSALFDPPASLTNKVGGGSAMRGGGGMGGGSMGGRRPGQSPSLDYPIQNENNELATMLKYAGVPLNEEFNRMLKLAGISVNEDIKNPYTGADAQKSILDKLTAGVPLGEDRREVGSGTPGQTWKTATGEPWRTRSDAEIEWSNQIGNRGKTYPGDAVALQQAASRTTDGQNTLNTVKGFLNRFTAPKSTAFTAPKSTAFTAPKSTAVVDLGPISPDIARMSKDEVDAALRSGMSPDISNPGSPPIQLPNDFGADRAEHEKFIKFADSLPRDKHDEILDKVNYMADIADNANPDPAARMSSRGQLYRDLINAEMNKGEPASPNQSDSKTTEPAPVAPAPAAPAALVQRPGGIAFNQDGGAAPAAAVAGQRPGGIAFNQDAAAVAEETDKDFAHILKHAGVPIKEGVLTDSTGSTMDHIQDRFRRDIKDFTETGDMSDDLYDALYDYYFDDMPYAVKKAKSNHEDQYQWIGNRFADDLGINENLISPMIMPVSEGSCNMTTEGSYCPEHGLAECGGMYEDSRSRTVPPRPSRPDSPRTKSVAGLGRGVVNPAPANNIGNQSPMAQQPPNVNDDLPFPTVNISGFGPDFEDLPAGKKLINPMQPRRHNELSPLKSGDSTPLSKVANVDLTMDEDGGAVGMPYSMGEGTDDPINSNSAMTGSYYEGKETKSQEGDALLARIKSLALLR